MMCQRIGRPPISTIGFGLVEVSSDNRVPRPPASITAFTWCRILFRRPGATSRNARTVGLRASPSPRWRATPISPVSVDVDDGLSDPMEVAEIVDGTPRGVLGKSIVIDDHEAARGQLRVEVFQGVHGRF